MFTGLIKHIGIVRDIVRVSETEDCTETEQVGYTTHNPRNPHTDPDTVVRINVDIPNLDSKVQTGDSISVNGICLTVCAVQNQVFTFDIGLTTARATTINMWIPGQMVNIEMPLTPLDPIGGHIVQGHIDGIGEIWAIIRNLMRIKIPDNLSPLIAKRGSIAVDGVSLTVSNICECPPTAAPTAKGIAGKSAMFHVKQNCANSWFEIHLIPETLQRTTLGAAQVGQRVNLETDILARHVQRLAFHTIS